MELAATHPRTSPVLSKHAERRGQQRGIRAAHVEATLDRGRCYHQRGGRCAYYLGKREVRHAAAQNVDVRAYEGTVVVVACDGDLVTVIKVSSPRRLRRAA